MTRTFDCVLQDSVSDLTKILDRDHQEKKKCKSVTGDLFAVSVLAACTGHSYFSSAIGKQKGFFLSFLENLADTKRTFIDVAHISTPHLSTFHGYVSHGPFSTGVSAASSILKAD